MASTCSPPSNAIPARAEQNQIQTRNPERAAVRGLWSDPDFLEKTGTPEFNRQLQHTQFADFHGHGWIFRAVFKHDRKGNLLDEDDKTVAFDDPDKFGKAVHLKTSISKKACTASTATSSRTATATANSTAKRATRSKSIASIATARFSSAPR